MIVSATTNVIDVNTIDVIVDVRLFIQLGGYLSSEVETVYGGLYTWTGSCMLPFCIVVSREGSVLSSQAFYTAAVWVLCSVVNCATIGV